MGIEEGEKLQEAALIRNDMIHNILSSQVDTNEEEADAAPVAVSTNDGVLESKKECAKDTDNMNRMTSEKKNAATNAGIAVAAVATPPVTAKFNAKKTGNGIRPVTDDDELGPPPGPPAAISRNPAILVSSMLQQPGAYPMAPTGFQSTDIGIGVTAAAGAAAAATDISVDIEAPAATIAEDASNTTSASTLPFEVQATAVEDEEVTTALMEKEIRKRILGEAVKACVVEQNDVNDNEEEEKEAAKKRKEKKRIYLLLLIVLVLAIGLGVGLTRAKDTDSNASETAAKTVFVDPDANLTTLELVRKRGHVRCGVSVFDFAKFVDEADNANPPVTGPHLEGMNVEQCRAMALLALEDPNQYELVLFDVYKRFTNLKDGDIDVMPDGSTHTMERDVWIADVEAAFTFTVPYFYSGLAFAGRPTFVDCVDDLNAFYGDCRNVRICVGAGSTHVAVLEDTLQGGLLVLSNNTEIMMEQYREDKCNVIAGEHLFLGKLPPDITDGWKMSENVVSKEPLAIVTRNDDPEWSNLANLVVNAFILAEAHNITQVSAHLMADLYEDDVQSSLAEQMVDLIAEFGNHGELYEKHIQEQIPRDAYLNQPYDASRNNGLLYSIPFGKLNDYGPDPVPIGTLAQILERGYLSCAVQGSRGAAFVKTPSHNSPEDWSGFDVEFCRGLAASIFAGNKDKVSITMLDEPTEGFVNLDSGKVDVVAGARVTLQASLALAPGRNHGYHFSAPYYYDNDTRDSYAFMTRENDIQWSDFVYWVVQAVIYAEEQAITANISGDMPVVTLFGEQLKQMFRDCISAVGSYAQLYNNALQDVIPRSGANRLNEGPPGAQMFPIALN